ATGAGKTPVAIEILRCLPGPSLAIAHRAELLDQAAEKMAVFGLVPELEKAESRASMDSPVVLASVQSLQRSRLERFPLNHFRGIWIDECHHAPAQSYRNIIERFPAAKVFGCTATLDRLDGEGYEEIFEKVSYEKDLASLIRESWLSRVMVRTLPVKIDLRGVKRTAGDFNIGDLSEAIGHELEKAAEQVVKNIADRNRVLAFTPTIDEARIFAQLCAERGVKADYVSGACSNRDEKVARFKDGDIKLLANCLVLTEGFDCPAIDTVVLLRPTQSRALLCQQVGRVTRLWPGKEFGLLLDFFWLTARHKLCAPADLDGVEEEPAAVDPDIPEPGRRKSLAQKLQEEGALEERDFDPLANQPADPFDVDAWLSVDHLFYDPYLRSAPTSKQVETLVRLGIPAQSLKNRGIVNGAFDMLKARWNRGLATVKQARYLTRLGHPNPWQITFSDASQAISNPHSWR
ncbi:MAG TPA: DEAD/DEAH box helicase, partial [Chthoniobacterales bacterium]|nr:DEAD/DEAH box helicase [Chthoniobacterales bacterium]